MPLRRRASELPKKGKYEMHCSFGVVLAAAMMTASATGCALSQDELGEAQAEVASAFTLHVVTDDLQVQVSSSTSSPNSCFSDCSFAYLGGSVLTLNVPIIVDRPNCLAFKSWTGACAGQSGRTCTLVMNSDLSAHAEWVALRGCSPQ